MKDNQEIDPVDSIEDAIQSAIDSAEIKEEIADEEPEEQPDDVETESEPETEEASDDVEGETDADDSDMGEDGQDDDESISDDAEDDEPDEPDDKLEAPEHWAANHREVFNGQDRKAQEFLLERHKDMEGVMTRKTQELAFKTRQFDAVEDALSPYKHEFAAAGLDNAGAVRQLASWHTALKSGGKDAVLKLASTYNIDMSEQDQDEYVDPQVASIKQELSALRQQTARQQQAAQQDQHSQLERVIDAFVNETDDSGKPSHPHFNVLHDDIVRLFNAGMVKDLPDAYTKALALRPDLAPIKPVITKQNHVDKVKRAKKAATGIKSSGSTKTKRADLSLEQEIAAHFK